MARADMCFGLQAAVLYSRLPNQRVNSDETHDAGMLCLAPLLALKLQEPIECQSVFGCHESRQFLRAWSTFRTAVAIRRFPTSKVVKMLPPKVHDFLNRILQLECSERSRVAGVAPLCVWGRARHHIEGLFLWCWFYILPCVVKERGGGGAGRAKNVSISISVAPGLCGVGAGWLAHEDISAAGQKFKQVAPQGYP